MDTSLLDTPVVLIVFNRPEVTRQVVAAIEAIQPAKLFVIADGPRAGNLKDAEACAEVRKLIVNTPWKGELITNFSEANLGCKARVSSGLDWVFGQVDQAIILEDDCLPNLTFFPYCQELLNYYRDDQRVMTVSGNNFQFGFDVNPYSYYFSHYNHCWGWASWRRAWQYYDVEMSIWPEVRDSNLLANIFHRKREVNYWTRILNAVHDNRINSWAYRWMFACWMQSGLTLLPQKNLVSNIGFEAKATHTKELSPFSKMTVYPMNFPLQHPPYVVRSKLADMKTDSIMFSLTPQARFRGKIKTLSRSIGKRFTLLTH